MESMLEWKAIVVIVWLGGFLFLERLYPASPWKAADSSVGFSYPNHLLQNSAIWVVNGLVYPLLIIAITSTAIELAWFDRPVFLQGLQGLLLDLLILDLWIYGWHRANHRLPVLWRFHQVHHYDEQLDATSAVRFHFGEVVLSALFRAPVVLIFAMPLSSVLIFETLVAMVTIFHHSNVRLPQKLENVLSNFMVTPSIHWVHHHAIRVDTDSNYGTILTIWDRLFSSLSPTRRWVTMPIGIEGKHENRIGKLFLLPFVNR